jgi:CheY-like chemotaxis protein
MLVEMLLDSVETRPVPWPFEGRVLILDDEALLRRLFVSALQTCGAACYAAATPAEAIRLLEHDAGIDYVVHDFDTGSLSAAASIERIRAMRPDVLIIGTSGTYRRGDFAALGVELYLQKPWHVTDLVNVLLRRIGD